MALFQIEKPQFDPLTPAQAAAILKISNVGDQLEFITRSISAAAKSLDGPAGELGRCLLAQKWAFTFDSFDRHGVELPLPPVISVDEVSYFDRSGAVQIMRADGYRVLNLGSEDHAVLMPAAGLSWPDAARHVGGCSVTMTCGYGTDGDDLPPDLLMAIGARMASHYISRESIAPSEYRPYRNLEIDQVIQRYRVRVIV